VHVAFCIKCEIHGENLNEDWLQELDTNSADAVQSQREGSSTRASGENVRKALTTYFKEK